MGHDFIGYNHCPIFCPTIDLRNKTLYWRKRRRRRTTQVLDLSGYCNYKKSFALDSQKSTYHKEVSILAIANGTNPTLVTNPQILYKYDHNLIH